MSHSGSDSKMSHPEDEWSRLGTGELVTEDQDVGLGHIVPVKIYVTVFIALMGLTILTVLAAANDFGIFNLVIALLIASVKAGIVTLFFMHLTWEGKTCWGIVIYPLFIFVLILGSTLGDSMVKKKIEPMTFGQNTAATAIPGAPFADHGNPAPAH